MGKCIVPVGSAVRWITLPTAPRGPSCKEKSQPFWALEAPQEQHLPLRLHLGRDPGRLPLVRVPPAGGQPAEAEQT